MNQKTSPILPISILVLILFLFLACNFPSSSKDISATATITPAVEYLQVTPAPRENITIIIRSVVPDAQARISEVVFVLPAELSSTEVYANNQKMDATLLEKQIMAITFSEETAAKKVVFDFKSSGQTLASCTLNCANLLAPKGDCSW